METGTLAGRLKAALAHSGKKKTDIWKGCRISSGAVSQWFNGATKTLEGANLINAAEVLGVNPDWLATGRGHMLEGIESMSRTYKSAPPVTVRRVPIISMVTAGAWDQIFDQFQPGDAQEWAHTTKPVKSHTFALRVDGDSMEPKFPNGSIIIVEPEAEARNGSFVIVRQNGDEATFKQLVIDGGHKMLKPLNPRYPIMEMRPDAHICGVVVQLIMDVPL